MYEDKFFCPRHYEIYNTKWFREHSKELEAELVNRNVNRLYNVVYDKEMSFHEKVEQLDYIINFYNLYEKVGDMKKGLSPRENAKKHILKQLEIHQLSGRTDRDFWIKINGEIAEAIKCFGGDMNYYVNYPPTP